ncbi:protein HtrL [Clostridia bacterium]|nr:protein HtrL [Clostridia bacterium]
MKGQVSSKDITIVTAFFDIHRGKMKGFERSNEKYLNDFKGWAAIENELVVYTDSDTAQAVRNIRAAFGLADRTKVVIVDDYESIDAELFSSIKTVVENKWYRDMHFCYNVPEAVSYKYNYIMILKAWCCSDAVERGIARGQVAWLDFGYNHGGLFYRSSDFKGFIWRYDFGDKINLFQLHEFDDLPVFEAIALNSTYIQGAPIIAPAKLWGGLWKSARNNMLALNKAGLADDDQLIWLMCYREDLEKFQLHKCRWYAPIGKFSDMKLEFIYKEKKRTFRDRLWEIRHFRNSFFFIRLQYVRRVYRNIRKGMVKW